MVKIVKGDIIRHPDHGLGQASHSEPGRGRWVVFRNFGGHWAAGVYDESQLDLVDVPEPEQTSLVIDRE